ncbi:TPA: ABC-three component system protein [Legionella pneumophila]
MSLMLAYYEQKFEVAFLRAKAEAFQEFFERLMGLAYKFDFMACRPWGKQGDHKNDGFLQSEKKLFQVYAPNEMTEIKAIKKIQEDFEGAKPYWDHYFNSWVFVYNGLKLPPHVQKELLTLQNNNPNIAIETWGLEELRLVFRLLQIQDLESWFGYAPTEETQTKLGFKDLEIVLKTLSDSPLPTMRPVTDVPSGKISANALSENVAELLRAGMVKAPLVADFFNQWHEATLGERVAESFRAKYESLRDSFLPNDIFTELQIWAGGQIRGTPEHELAVLTVIAYYFERCDIFEAPRTMS